MSPCPYCGNTPTPHAAARVSERLQETLIPIEWIFYGPVGRFLERISEILLPPTVWLAGLLKIVTYNLDAESAPTDRANVLWREANRREIHMKQFLVFGRPLDAYRARIGNKNIMFDGLPIPPHFSLRALRWLDDKEKLRVFLHKRGIPAPRGAVCTRFSQMRSVFYVLEKPVIVKPARGSRGRHTTTHIHTEEQLRKAFEVGKQIARRLIIEEQLEGPVFRATVINGKLIGVVRGDPPQVVGDGRKTIRELIGMKNEKRPVRVGEIFTSTLTADFLARQSLTFDSVLPTGKTIDLSEKIGLSYGGHSAEDFPLCHPETKKILERAGALVGFPIMGFDFIIPDISKDPSEQTWGIIECNSLPFIDLHHHPIEGTPINAAKAVWDLWEDDSTA